MQTYELEQSFASVVAFILAALPEPVTPYFHTMPERTAIPSVFFPDPEIEYRPQTLADFQRIRILYAMFFGKTTHQAHALAAAADMRIHRARDRVPLLDEHGSPTDRYARIRGDQSAVRTIEENEASVQFTIQWVVPYKYDRPDVQKIIKFYPSYYLKGPDGETSTPRPRP